MNDKGDLKNEDGVIVSKKGELTSNPSLWHTSITSGRVLVWLLPADQPEGVPAHIDTVTRSFGMGIDVSEGVGKSNSTIEVFATQGREQAAAFADNTISPPDLARMAAAMARYWNNALICPVRPLHGVAVIRTLVDECGYHYIWFDTSKYGMSEQQTHNLGWASGEASSAALFFGWRDDIQHERCILHSLDCWNEHKQYIYDEFGRVTHQNLAHLPASVRDKHGDRVIAAALARRACIDLPRFQKIKPKDTAPVGSFNYRRKLYQERLAKEKDGEWD